MFKALKALYRRYSEQHFSCALAGFELTDYKGDRWGNVEHIEFRQSRIVVKGWTIADSVKLRNSLADAECTPSDERCDVTNALNLDAHRKTGFEISVHGGLENSVLSLIRDKESLSVALPKVSRRSLMMARLMCMREFLHATTINLGSLTRAWLNPTAAAKQRVKNQLGLASNQTVRKLDKAILAKGSLPGSDQKITLIVPVFNAFDIMTDCLARLVAYTDVQWRLIIVEDASTDRKVRPWLNDWVSRQTEAGHDIRLIHNARNLGFIKSVNKAFNEALKHNDHVMLINSDALVAKNWASRLLSPILNHRNIASVTPFSNDAEIFTTPVQCQRYSLPNLAVDVLNEHLSQVVNHGAVVEAPTGVGFCMAMNIRFLRKIPEFDEVFGLGYGEEVDWCQKAARIGGKHVLQPSVFVEHYGGGSFGSLAKREALAKNGQIVSSRYPNFDNHVQDFINSDPAFSARFCAALAATYAVQQKVSIFVGHSMGGGAEKWLADEINELHSDLKTCVVLRVGTAARWQIELHLHDAEVMKLGVQSDEDVLHVLQSVGSREITYSCGVGHEDPLALPDFLLAVSAGKKHDLVILFHDYFPVQPSYTLVPQTQEGSVGDEKSIGPAVRRRWVSQAEPDNNLEEWRSKWGGVLNAAGQVICFSQSSAEIVCDAYPETEAKICIKPHQMQLEFRHVLSNRNGPIGVLGAIGEPKGAQVVSSLAHSSAQFGTKPLVLIGSIDPRFDLPSPSTLSGPYKRDEIAQLCEGYALSCIVIPSIWLETFCYTMHEALHTGLPVFCFDIGAQAEATHGARNGYTMPLDWMDKPQRILEFIDEVLAGDSTSESVDLQAQTGRDRGAAA